MNDFEKLVGELEALNADTEAMTKALPADDGKDDDKIQAAAAEGGDGDATNDGGEGGDDADGAADGDDKPMAKSMNVTLEDGTTVEALDGTELIKSLTARLDKSAEGQSQMAKALEAVGAVIKSQGELIKSLNEKLTKLAGAGRGRKAVLSVAEKPAPGETMTKSEPEGLSGEQFMAKAMDAMKAGRISGTDVAVAEASLNRGVVVPAHIVQRVLQS
jgi:hypothetical protein